MTDLVLSQGVRVINGVEMMGSRKLMSICGVGEHFNFVRDLKKLFKVQNLDSADIKGVFVEFHEAGNIKEPFHIIRDIGDMIKFVNKDEGPFQHSRFEYCVNKGIL